MWMYSPTALSSMIFCAFAFAAMMELGLAERAPLKKVRMKLIVAVLDGGRIRE
jgi:hypothetical protein